MFSFKAGKMKTRRLGIFVFYDQDGIVGNYVYYLLDEISQWVHHLVIVCNGKLSAEGSERFHQYTEDVFVRENSGYDGTAYKEVILNLYGIDKVREFDELLLFNDSCYAPIYPFEVVFDKMKSDDIDFWGITEYESVSPHIAKHIQAYFICIHSHMLHSPEFREFWNTMEPIYEYEDAVRYFEIKFTTYFSENGYRWRTLIGESCYLLNYDGYEMMKYHHCPFVKRKIYTSFAEGALLSGGNVGIAKMTSLIEQRTMYDVRLIWQDLIRKCNPTDLKNRLNLNYMISSEHAMPCDLMNKTAVLIQCCDIDSFLWNAKFMTGFEGDFDIYFLISKDLEHKITEFQPSYEGRFRNQLITDDHHGTFLTIIQYGKELFEHYEFVCYLNTTGQKTESACQKMLRDNLLGDEGYCRRILEIFQKNPYIGILYPPMCIFKEELNAMGNQWGKWYKETQQLSNILSLECRIAPDIPPVSLSDSFWCRTKACRRLFDTALDLWPSEEAEEILKRLMGFVVQDAGYACGTVRDLDYAQACFTSFEAGNEMFFQHYKKNNVALSLEASIGFSGAESLLSFSKRVKNLYVYGAGKYGKKILEFLADHAIKISGVIVSDGESKAQGLHEYEIFYLNELILDTESDGIIIALGGTSKEAIHSFLKERGYQHLFFY